MSSSPSLSLSLLGLLFLCCVWLASSDFKSPQFYDLCCGAFQKDEDKGAKCRKTYFDAICNGMEKCDAQITKCFQDCENKYFEGKSDVEKIQLHCESCTSDGVKAKDCEIGECYTSCITPSCSQSDKTTDNNALDSADKAVNPPGGRR